MSYLDYFVTWCKYTCMRRREYFWRLTEVFWLVTPENSSMYVLNWREETSYLVYLQTRSIWIFTWNFGTPLRRLAVVELERAEVGCRLTSRLKSGFLLEGWLEWMSGDSCCSNDDSPPDPDPPPGEEHGKPNTRRSDKEGMSEYKVGASSYYGDEDTKDLLSPLPPCYTQKGKRRTTKEAHQWISNNFYNDISFQFISIPIRRTERLSLDILYLY